MELQPFVPASAALYSPKPARYQRAPEHPKISRGGRGDRGGGKTNLENRKTGKDGERGAFLWSTEDRLPLSHGARKHANRRPELSLARGHPYFDPVPVMTSPAEAHRRGGGKGESGTPENRKMPRRRGSGGSGDNTILPLIVLNLAGRTTMRLTAGRLPLTFSPVSQLSTFLSTLLTRIMYPFARLSDDR